MKHTGKMSNNGAKVVIAYRTLPGDSSSALVIGTNNLNDTYHDAIMNLLQDVSGQQANEFADILSVRKFPDGNNMLEWLHTRGHLKKVPTKMVIVTPNTQNSIPLNELNEVIAQQKGRTVDELAISDEGKSNKKIPSKDDPTRTTSVSVNAGEEDSTSELVTPTITPKVVEEDISNLSPTQLRSKADKLFKEAQLLRKQADAVDPPKKRIKAA
jgi:hypothetical protein